MKSAFLVYNIVDFSLMCPNEDSNLDLILRTDLLYPVELSGLIYFSKNKTPSWRLR